MLHSLLATVAAGALSVVACASPPDLFTDASYDDAMETSVTESKLLLVDATAVWCGPCKRMDQTTWIDAKVVEWIDAHAIAIQIDVDEQKPLAQTLAISAMPTIIAFQGGEEIDRIVGYRDGDGLLVWLNGLLNGETSLDLVRRAAARAAEDGDGAAIVDARLDLARALVNHGAYDEAAREYAWLWSNMVELNPAMAGVRGSFTQNEMKRLATRSATARKHFDALRSDAHAALAAPDAAPPQLSDWIDLCSIVGRPRDVVEWYRTARNDDATARLSHRASDDLFDALLAADAWALAGTVYDEPLKQADAELSRHAMMIRESERYEEPMRSQVRGAMNERVRSQVANLHAACLASKRPNDAAAIAQRLLTAFDDADTRIALVKAAIAAKVAGDQHRTWLDEAEATSEKTWPALHAKLRSATAA